MAGGNEMGSSGKSPLVMVLLGANSLLLAGLIGLVVVKGGLGGGAPGGPGGSAPAEAGVPVGAGPTVRLSDFVVHLRNPEADRYARISFEIELSSEAAKNELAPHVPKIRDVFLSYLSDRTVEELRGSEGLEKTKLALLERLAQLVPNARPRALYITDFVVQ